MYSSNARKRSAPTITPGGPKRHQSVYWKSSLEAGPSGTGITDTRSRSPERSIFRKYAAIPSFKNIRKLPQEDQTKIASLNGDMKYYVEQGLSKENAMKKFREKWTQYVEAKYGSAEAMGVGGLVDVSIVDDEAEDSSHVVVDDDDNGEVETADEGADLLAIEAMFASFTPEDPVKDLKICQEMNELIVKVQRFARMFNKKGLRATPAEFLESLLRKENEQLIRYIGCLAIGGKNGREGWEELVNAPEMREALVVGIMGRALKEHVFSDLYFGASDELKQDLMLMQEQKRDEDGFLRKKAQAELVQRKLGRHGDARYRLDRNLMFVRFQKLLAPFYEGKTDSTLPSPIQNGLRGILDAAIDISRLMRLAPDVVYYWTSTFKDEEFDPERMECYNLHEMISNSPYEREVVNNREQAKLREGAGEERKDAIVKIVCFPGLEAYRKGGGGLAEEMLARENSRPDHAPPDVRAARKRNGEKYKSSDGYRSRTICKSIVYLIWGKQRLLTREAGTSRHIDAVRSGDMSKYTKDYEGFVELYDLAKQKWEQEAARASPSRLGSFLGR